MLISDKYKYIFISIPKTGTTAIQSFLLENDKSCVLNTVQIKGKEVSVDEHIKTEKLKKIMGDQFNEYTVFTFIRNPYMRKVSGYFFYKNGDTLHSHYFIRNLMANMNILLTKLIPFSIWSIVKPSKKLTDYFFDKDNQLLIDLVGKTENLNEDLLMICEKIGIELSSKKIPVKNKSTNSTVEYYFSNRVHKRIFSQIMREDIKLYQLYENKLYADNP